MKNEIKVLVVKDNEGILRPMAGIWIDNESGQISKGIYLSKNEKNGDTVINAILIEAE